MSICKHINANLASNCDDPLVNAIDDQLILINFDDIDVITRNATNKQIIEGITIKTASPQRTAYTVEGKNYSNIADDALAKGKYIDGWEHNVLFLAMGNDPDYKLWVENLAGSRIVAIVKNKYENLHKVAGATGGPSDSLYEIYGLDTGLEVKTIVRNKMDADNKGSFVIQMGCNELVKEPHLPATFFITDKSTTEAAVNALL